MVVVYFQLLFCNFIARIIGAENMMERITVLLIEARVENRVSINLILLFSESFPFLLPTQSILIDHVMTAIESQGHHEVILARLRSKLDI